MARPRDTEGTRELALRAVGVLQRLGLTVSVEQLARELGVKRPTLLYRLPTYGKIIEIALSEMLLEQIAFVERRVSEHTHPIDRLRARMQAIYAFYTGRESRLLFLTQAVAVTGGGDAADLLRKVSSFFEGARVEMVSSVERGIEDGLVHACDAEALVSMVRSINDGLTIQRVVSPGGADRVLEMFWEKVLLPLKRTPSSTEKKAARKKKGAR